MPSPLSARAGFNRYENPPKVKIGADGVARYRGEADNLESPSALSAPLSSFSSKVASRKIQPKNVLNYIIPTVLPQVKKNTKSSLPENSISHTFSRA